MATIVVGRGRSVEGARVVVQERVGEAGRLAFVDNLRVVLTALVIAHHAGQAYGPGGAWPVSSPERAWVLGPFFSVNAAFFMGLFFLVAGYFLPGAFDRKGARGFLTDRALRLGAPLLFTALALFGPIAYLGYEGELSFPRFIFQVYLGGGQLQVAHLWFIAHLLLYAAGYAAWRRFAPRAPRLTRLVTESARVPGQRAILGLIVALAVVTAVVRVWFPIDRWEHVLGLVPVEVAHLPQYMTLFVIGVAAARRDWLLRFPAAAGLMWLGIGSAAAVARYAYAALRSREVLPALVAPGGRDWRSLVWSGWEALICVGLCIGLLILAREVCNRQGRIGRALAAGSYATYVVHLWPVIGLQFALTGVALPPLVKFAVVTLAAVPLSFVLGGLIRRLPGVKRVL